MIGVGSRVRLRSDLPRSVVKYYSNFNIFPNHVYTITRYTQIPSSLQCQLDTGYWADTSHLVDYSFEVNLEKILK